MSDNEGMNGGGEEGVERAEDVFDRLAVVQEDVLVRGHVFLNAILGKRILGNLKVGSISLSDIDSSKIKICIDINGEGGDSDVLNEAAFVLVKTDGVEVLASPTSITIFVDRAWFNATVKEDVWSRRKDDVSNVGDEESGRGTGEVKKVSGGVSEAASDAMSNFITSGDGRIPGGTSFSDDGEKEKVKTGKIPGTSPVLRGLIWGLEEKEETE